MKACVLREPGAAESSPLEYGEVDQPHPVSGELLIRVHACGVCRTDLHVVEGELPVRRSPLIPGHQVVGTVAALGDGVADHVVGDRVGVAWLHRTCGACRFCVRGCENLCEHADFTGWTVNGGFAEYMVAPSQFVYSIPTDISDVQAAPLLCAGIIGYRALRLTGLDERWNGWEGAKLGIYGFGAAGHIAIQLARARGAVVYVFTRDKKRHQALARELGAVWVGDAADRPPELLDASIIFAPAGELVPVALACLDQGGVLVLGGIHMSPIPAMEYQLLYGERVVRSVANNTREDGRLFLAECQSIGIRTQVETFPLSRANEALTSLKNDAIRGAAVLSVADSGS